MGRSTVYAARDREESDGPAGLKKRGPKTKLSDEELVEEIRQVLKESDFLGEGHRKVRARLRAEGIGCGQEPRAAADAGEWAAGPRTARKAPAWGPEPQRPDHDGCAERAVGYGRDAVLHEGGWVVLVLRGGGSLRHRRGGLARGEEGRSVGSARADPPGCTNPHGTATRPRSLWGSAYGTTGALSTPPISSKESWPGSGSARRPRT